MECKLCPRACGALRGQQPGACGMGEAIKVARAAPHMWEEPCLSGTRGSGTVFFAGCPLGCVFCQNHAISHGGFGREVSEAALAGIFLRLQRAGAHNLNLVSATQFLPGVRAALALARRGGLALPVVWNTGGYETPEAVEALAPDVDIWLADLKFFSPALSAQLCSAPDYFAVASRAILRMAALAGPPRFDGEGLLQSGLVLRLLVLPGQREDAKAILRWMAESLPGGGFLLSLMSQYTPPPGIALPKPFGRRVSSFEYRDVLETAHNLGLENGYAQERSSAEAGFTPPFDLTGVIF